MHGFVKVLVFLVLLFVISAAAVVAARLDQLTISLLGGVMLGVLLAAPIATLVTYLALRQRHAEAMVSTYSQMRQQPAPQSLPPQIMMLPAPAAYQPPAQAMRQPMYQPIEPFTLPTHRRFYMIGDDGSASEINPSADFGQP